MEPGPVDLLDQLHLHRPEPASLDLQVLQQPPSLSGVRGGDAHVLQRTDVRAQTTDRLRLRRVGTVCHDPHSTQGV